MRLVSRCESKSPRPVRRERERDQSFIYLQLYGFVVISANTPKKVENDCVFSSAVIMYRHLSSTPVLT